MAFNVTRFGDGEQIVTTVVNRPINEIVAFLNTETEGSLSVTQYNVGDDISADIMNAPLIQIRDYLNSLAQCNGPLVLDLYVDGEDVTAANLNRPIDQIVQFINSECSFESEIPTANSTPSDPYYDITISEDVLYAKTEKKEYNSSTSSWDFNELVHKFDISGSGISFIWDDHAGRDVETNPPKIAEMDSSSDGWFYMREDNTSLDGYNIRGFRDGVSGLDHEWTTSILDFSGYQSNEMIRGSGKIAVIGNYVYSLDSKPAYRISRTIGNGDTTTTEQFIIRQMQVIGSDVMIVVNENDVGDIYQNFDSVYKIPLTTIDAINVDAFINYKIADLPSSVDAYYGAEYNSGSPYSFLSANFLIVMEQDSNITKINIGTESVEWQIQKPRDHCITVDPTREEIYTARYASQQVGTPEIIRYAANGTIINTYDIGYLFENSYTMVYVRDMAVRGDYLYVSCGSDQGASISSGNIIKIYIG